MNYYEILGVPRNASKEQIQKAYHALAVQLHPDANPGDNTAADKMSQVNKAYQVLRNPAKRKEYDESLGGGSPRAETRREPSPGRRTSTPTGSPLEGFLGDLRAQAFGGAGDRASQSDAAQAGGPPTITLELTAAEALRGATKTIFVNKRPLKIRIVIKR
jgi:DnaJ-class molecular chaperone